MRGNQIVQFKPEFRCKGITVYYYLREKLVFFFVVVFV